MPATGRGLPLRVLFEKMAFGDGAKKGANSHYSAQYVLGTMHPEAWRAMQAPPVYQAARADVQKLAQLGPRHRPRNGRPARTLAGRRRGSEMLCAFKALQLQRVEPRMS